MSKALLLLLVICSLAHALVRPIGNKFQTESQSSYPVNWFTQRLDHYNAQDFRTFNQRYYINADYYAKNNIGVLYINGEGPAEGPPSSPNDEVVLIAKQYSAVIVTIEHRYYGRSQPFADVSTPNLVWLSSKQALNDLANFLMTMDKQLYQPNGHDNGSNGGQFGPQMKWIVVGGSYSGALTAWFRIKFPHLTVGGIASSGVVDTRLAFPEFDEQVSESVGPTCASALRQANRALEAAVTENAEQVRALFNASCITLNGDFYYMVADCMAESVQYGYQQQLCDTFEGAVQKGDDLVKVFASYANDFFYQTFGTPCQYSYQYQSIVNQTTDTIQYRQWWYQKCTEVGYFQIAPATDYIRSPEVNLIYHMEHCNRIFGIPLWPNTTWTDIYYGGSNPKSYNIVFVNGSQDPWRRASVNSTLNFRNLDETSIVVNCTNCGHCVDLGGCPGGCTNQRELTNARNYVINRIGKWLNANAKN